MEETEFEEKLQKEKILSVKYARLYKTTRDTFRTIASTLSFSLIPTGIASKLRWLELSTWIDCRNKS